MSYFLVTAASLREKAEAMKGLNARFKTNVENLITTEQGLKQMWEGEANEAFHKAFTTDATKMEAFHTAIEKYIEALLIIAAKYEEAEAKNVNTASS